MTPEENVPKNIPEDVTALDAGDALYDRHRKEYYLVEAVDEEGVSLRRDEREYYVPHALFAPWHDSRLVSIDEVTEPTVPEWLRNRR